MEHRPQPRLLRTFAICAERLEPLQWAAINAGFAATLDLPASGVNNPAVECSAMSAAFRIELAPIMIEGEFSPPPVVDPCAPDSGVRPDVTTRG